MTFAYGKQVNNKLSMGLSLKRITNTLDTFSQSFSSVDASILPKVNENYRFGMAIRNVISQAPANSNDRLPLTIRIGNAYSMMNKRLTLAADLNSSKGTGFGWNVGTEYWLSHRTAFRMGMESRNSAIAETTAGLGFSFTSFNLDLAVGLSELGMSQRFSFVVEIQDQTVSKGRRRRDAPA